MAQAQLIALVEAVSTDTARCRTSRSARTARCPERTGHRPPPNQTYFGVKGAAPAGQPRGHHGRVSRYPMNKAFTVVQRRSSTPAPCRLGRAHTPDCYSRRKQSSSGLADTADSIDVCTTAWLAENGLIGRCSRSQPCEHRHSGARSWCSGGLDESSSGDDVVAQEGSVTGHRSHYGTTKSGGERWPHVPLTVPQAGRLVNWGRLS